MTIAHGPMGVLGALEAPACADVGHRGGAPSRGMARCSLRSSQRGARAHKSDEVLRAEPLDREG